MSNRRVGAAAALLVCNVESTKCPVRAERTAISMASRSSRPVLRRLVKMTRSSLVYFAGDFLADNFRRFFSSGEIISGSVGRI